MRLDIFAIRFITTPLGAAYNEMLASWRLSSIARRYQQRALICHWLHLVKTCGRARCGMMTPVRIFDFYFGKCQGQRVRARNLSRIFSRGAAVLFEKKPARPIL